MQKITFFVVLMLLFVVFSVRAGFTGPEQSPGTMLDNEQKKTDKSREVACDCCQKCMAAKKPIKSNEKGPPAINGCRDCCDRCGKVEQLPQEKTPPEIIKMK